jgi:D-xylose transport system substrate-binding protein
MTVYKPIENEAKAAAELAIKLFKGQKTDGLELTKVKDPESGAYIPARLLTPKVITKTNVNEVIEDKFVTRKSVCSGDYAKYCVDAGI